MYRPRERRIDLSLSELRLASSELADAMQSLRWLIQEPDEPEIIYSERPRGRPRRGDLIDPERLKDAPIPELALAAAQDVSAIVTRIGDRALLEKARDFEREHDGRKSVIDVIERRLRALAACGPAGTLSAPQGQKAP